VPPAKPTAAVAPGTKQPIEINAESNRYDKDTDVFFAEGNVVFRDGTAKIIGDALRYDPKKREVDVAGSARVEREGKVMIGEKIRYWLDTGKVQADGPSKTIVPEKPAK
jgi:lipopolysaccharide export system protein LptA